MSRASRTTTWDLIRHGEPAGGSRYRGQLDDPLSDVGWRQMYDAVQGRGPWNRILSSPLQRCADFAQALAESEGLEIILDERIMEIGFGAWEGMTRAQVESAAPGAMRRFYRDPVNCPPQDAEQLAMFRERVASAWGQWQSQYGGERVLVVCHAGVIRMILCLVLEIPLSRIFQIQIPYAALTRITTEDGATPRIQFHV